MGSPSDGDRPAAVPEEIREALDRFRGRVRGMRALRGIGVTVAAGAVLFGVSVALDRALVLSGAMRSSLTALALSGAALSALLTIVLPLLKPIPDRRAARGLESSAPSLEEGLISTLELIEDGAPPGTSRRLVDALARSTAGKVAALQIARLIDPRPAHLRLWAALAALLLLLAYASFDLRGFSMMASRFLHPGRDLPRPSSVGLRVLPGNAVIGIDDDFTVDAAVMRGNPPGVSIRWRVPGGEWREAAMEPRGARGAPPAGGSGAEFRHEFRRARQTFEYQALAGDSSCPVYRVEVRERPRPELFTITYSFPAYTRRVPAMVVSPRGDLSAVAGTACDLDVIVSGHPAVASLHERGAESAVPLEVEPVSGSRDRVRARVEIRKGGAYNLHLEDGSGVSNRGGESYSIQAEIDRPPRVRVLSPRTLEVVVEDAGRLEIQFQAQDDFGIEDLAVAAGSTEAGDPGPGVNDGEGVPAGAGETSRRIPIPLDSGGGPGRTLVNGSYRWDLAALGLRPGESVPFRLVATDGLGQAGASPEMVLRMAFLPDPPEGADWMAGLRELQRGIAGALAGWAALLDAPGAERAASYAADPARADRLGRSGEELLKELSRLRRLGEEASSLGRSIPIPSVNRAAFGNLGAALRRFTEEEGRSLWSEILDTSGRIREALRAKGREAAGDVAAGPLHAAQDRGSGRLLALAGQFTAMHRAERLEVALERLRALLSAEEEAASRSRDLAGQKVPGPAEGAAPPAPAAPVVLARLQRGIRIEATALGAELEGIAKLGGSEDAQFASLSLAYLQSVAPLLAAAREAVEAPDPKLAAAPLEAAARAFRDAEASLSRESARIEEAAHASRAALVPSPNIPDRLARLGAAETAAAFLLEKGGLDGVAEAAAGDRARRPELVLLRSDLNAEAETSEKAQPPDFESAGDVFTLRDIFRGLSEDTLGDAARRTEEIRLALIGAARPRKPAVEDLKPVIADRRRAAEVLDGLSKAFSGIEPGARLGGMARQLEAIAETEESIAWQLRSTPAGHARALRVRAGIERELRIALEEIREALEVVLKGIPEGSPSRDGLAAGLAEVPPTSKAAAEAAAACLAGDPSRALAASLEAARTAGEASRRIDEARAGLPGVASARAWIQRQIGSLPERVERLAQAERAHAETLKKLCLELTGPAAAAPDPAQPPKAGPLQPERVAALGVDQDLLREEGLRLASQASREAGRIAAAPVTESARKGLALSIRHLDLAAGRILEVSRSEMARASRAIGAASRSLKADSQRDLLEQAVSEEDRAADLLSQVARNLRLLDERETVEVQTSDLETLLAAPPPQADDPASVKRALEEARALLDGVLRAAEILSVRLPEGVLKSELLDRLRGAAEKFREALAAGAAGDGARAVALVEEGRTLLGEAVSLARRIRGETEAVLAGAEGDEGAQGKEKKPMSRELQEVYAELQKIQALRERQGRIQEGLEELLRDSSGSDLAQKMKEIAKMEGALAEEVGARFLSISELVELVADLLAGGNEAKRIGEAERRIRGEASAAGNDPARSEPLRARQEGLLGEGAEMARELQAAGAVLTINLPKVLKPFWEAEAHLDPALQAMGEALGALGQAQLPIAGEGLRKAAVELDVLADLLGIARQRALEEIAAREEEDSSADFSQPGMEAALEALKRAAQELAMGRPEAALATQQSAMRGLTSAAEAMRARLDRMRQEPGQDIFLSRILDEAASIPGLSWEVLIRGDEAKAEKKDEEGKADDASTDASDAFPEDFRELVRIYLRALAGER